MKNAREVAITALLRVQRDGGYSNLVLDSILEKSNLSKEDKAFATRLFYGVIEKKILLDYNISKLATKPLSKLDAEILCILETGLYQLLFMDNVPDSAAVNESVKLCYFTKKSFAKGFVNALLRSKIRQNKQILLPEEADKNYLSVKISADKSIADIFEKQFGIEETLEIFSAFDGESNVYIRVNTNKTDVDGLMEKLKKYSIIAEKCSMNDCLKLSKAVSLTKSDEFLNGEFYFQDLSCQYSCMALEAENAKRILDVCAAPGGKSFTISLLSKNAEVVSCDISKNRVSLIEGGAKRLGLTNVKPTVQDATVFNEQVGLFDRILCDVPCSGLGVISKKPEIRLKKIDENALFETQMNILKNASRYLVSGGILVYSTCTLNKRENEDVINAFLNDHPDFEPHTLCFATDGEFTKTFMPNKDDCDGFFVSAIRKK